MHLDLGIQGLGILVGLSLVFGVIAQLVFRRTATLWLWLIGAAAYFVGGLFASEVLWGTYTEDEIQPIIDGLAFDEALLFGLGVGLLAVVLTWLVVRSNRVRRTAAS